MAYSPVVPLSFDSTSRIPLREILPWAVLAFAAAFVAMYFVGFEEGAWSVVNSNVVHEFVHDARHLAGLPCH